MWAAAEIGDGGLGIAPAVIIGSGLSVSFDCTWADVADAVVTIVCAMKTGLASIGAADSVAIDSGMGWRWADRAEDAWALHSL